MPGHPGRVPSGATPSLAQIRLAYGNEADALEAIRKHREFHDRRRGGLQVPQDPPQPITPNVPRSQLEFDPTQAVTDTTEHEHVPIAPNKQAGSSVQHARQRIGQQMQQLQDKAIANAVHVLQASGNENPTEEQIIHTMQALSQLRLNGHNSTNQQVRQEEPGEPSGAHEIQVAPPLPTSEPVALAQEQTHAPDPAVVVGMPDFQGVSKELQAFGTMLITANAQNMHSTVNNLKIALREENDHRYARRNIVQDLSERVRSLERGMNRRLDAITDDVVCIRDGVPQNRRITRAKEGLGSRQRDNRRRELLTHYIIHSDQR